MLHHLPGRNGAIRLKKPHFSPSLRCWICFKINSDFFWQLNNNCQHKLRVGKMRETDSWTAKTCRVLLLSYKTRCAFLTLFWISDCWLICVLKERFVSAQAMASLLPWQWGIYYCQPELHVHLLIKRALLCLTSLVSSYALWYNSLLKHWEWKLRTHQL